MSSNIPKVCLGLEPTLSDKKRQYSDKVQAILGIWEHVASYIGSNGETSIEDLIEWANERTLELVLRGEWPKLPAASKTHLNVTVQRCTTLLSQQPQHQTSVQRCQALIKLVQNPWEKPVLKAIISGQISPEHEEEEFCCQERGELLKMRLKVLCEDRCEDIAINLAAACVRSLRRNERLRLLSAPEHVNYMIDVYIVLLYKQKRINDIVAQLELMELKDGLELMQRLGGERPTKYGTARVWRNSGKAAELVAQYLVTAGMVRPISGVGRDTLESILNSWARLHARAHALDEPVAGSDLLSQPVRYNPMLPGIVRKLIDAAMSAQHIYIFCGVLVRNFGEPLKPLVIELYIRALTADMNELENQKSKKNKEKEQETAQRLSREILQLADYVRDSLNTARECVLTAFSLHPTRECYERIKELAVACGKIKQETASLESLDATVLETKSADELESDDELSVKIEITEVKESMKEEPMSQNKETELTSIDNKTGVTLKQNGDASITLSTTTTTTTTTTMITVKKVEPTETINGTKTLKLLNSMARTFNDKDKCHLQNIPLKNEELDDKDSKGTSEPRPDDSEETSKLTNGRSHQEAIILIKGDAITDSSNCDEKAVPGQCLEGEKLGINPQLVDDLAVVLSSQRYRVLTWLLDWKELSELCERYLENAEEMRNTNKELKYLNIDYSQFKDHPYDENSQEYTYGGIEKGYEQWDDSDYSESGAVPEEQSTTTSATKTSKIVNGRRPNESSDTDSENVVVQPAKRGRPRKVLRVESSESEYDIRNRKPRSKFKKTLISSSESSDTNTQDSQTSSLGSDGFKRSCGRMPKKTCNNAKKVTKHRPRKLKLPNDSVSHFHMLVNENIRPNHSANGVSDNNRNDIMTLFSADMDENKCETLKSTTFEAAQLIISEKRSDPKVINALRMYRPHGKKLSQINEKSNCSIDNGVVIKKEKINVGETEVHTIKPNMFAPMLSTLNLNPKIALRRVDEIDKKLTTPQKRKKKQPVVTSTDLSNELLNIQKSIPFSSTKNAFTSYAKSRLKRRKNSSLKGVPGMHSMEFSGPVRVQSTVHVVQLSRGLSAQSSPNSASTTTAANSTPPRGTGSNGNRVGANAIQLPGTPSSTSGHDSGVGMSPAGQTPPPTTRSSSLQDVGEEANPPPDTSPGQMDSTSTTTLNSSDGTRTVVAVLANQKIASNQSPKKLLTSTGNNTGEQQLVIYKPDGTYHLVSPNIVAGHRGILLEDGSIGFARQVTASSLINADLKVAAQSQTNKNTGLPKFQQAFGKTICPLTTESTTALPSSSATDTHEASTTPAGTTQNVQQQRTVVKGAVTAAVATASNLTKAVQTSVPNARIASIPNLQVSSGTRQILNLMQSAVSSSTGTSGASTATGQALIIPNSPGVIYTQKLPGALAAGNSGQIISIPASLSNSRSPVQVKLNIIRTGTPIRAGALQAVLASRLQQQQQQSQQTQQSQAQQQIARPADALINSSIDMPNQVSSSTLEQLREFESVLEQVKERSTSQSTTADTTTVQTQTQTARNSPKLQAQVAVNSLTQQLLLQSEQSPSSTVEFSSNGNPATFQQQEVFPQKVALMYTNQNSGSSTPKAANSSTTPVVVVTSYCQPAASPALSVTSQSSSSPCVTPAPAPVSSTGKVQPQSSSKSAKKAAPKTVKQVNTQAAAKTAPIPKPQQKPQEDPETTQRIYAILGQYAEQLRNSPDLNNKPAPRRRSNPPTNPNQSSKRKKSGSSKSKSSSGQQTSEPSPSPDDAGRTMGSSEDSSGGGMGGVSSGSANGSGLMHIQDSPSAGFSASEETLAGSNNNSQSGTPDNATLTSITEARSNNAPSDSNDGTDVNVKRRNLIFTEPNTGVSGQTRAVVVQEAAVQSTSVGEALASVTGKMTTGTAVLVSGTNFMLPMNFVKSGQQITVVSGGSKLLAAVPAVRTSTGATGAVSNAFVLQSLLSQANKVIQHQNQQKHQQQQTATNKIAQSGQIIIPQTSSVVRFANEDSNIDKPDDCKSSTESVKAPTTTIGLLQHSGVITSNPNIGQRFFNSAAMKLPVKSDGLQQQIVCLTAPSSALKEPLIESQKPPAATIAFAFANDVATMQIKKESSANNLISIDESTKPVKRKDTTESSVVVVSNVGSDAITHCNASAETLPKTEPLSPAATITTSVSTPSPSLATTITTATTTTATSSSVATATSSTSLESTSQFLIAGGPSSSDSQESASSTIPSSSLEASSSMDDGTKVENGVLCGSNARLQEAWEPCEERKVGESSPDTTPWRYVPAASCNSLDEQQLKAYGTAHEVVTASNVDPNTPHSSVLQIIGKGHSIELSSTGGVFQTKKYYQHSPTMNNSIAESFQPAKGLEATKSSGQTSAGARTPATSVPDPEHQRKQQILECELRLQKSLSEECEDLGVDEPSTSDLFPEADLQLFDANHSPSFDNSSQEASCSQTLSGPGSLSGIKSYSNATSFFNVSSSATVSAAVVSSRDASSTSPIVKTNSPIEPKKKTPQQKRTPKTKETTVRRNKRSLEHGLQAVDNASSVTAAKQLRLSLTDSLSQEEASNSNSDLPSLPSARENELTKETSSCQKLENHGPNGRDSTSSSSNRQIDINTSSGSAEIARRAVGCNDTVSSTAASSGEEDESLTLLEESAANVTIPSPLSPIAGPLLMTHRYTYSNSKKRAVPVKQTRPSNFFSDPKTSNLSWDSPTSGRTRSSSDDEMNDEENEADESSMSESLAPTPVFDSIENTTVSNGLEMSTQRSLPIVKATPIDHATYSAKKKTPASRRININNRDLSAEIPLSIINKSTDTKPSSVITINSANKRSKAALLVSAALTPTTTNTSETESLSPAPLSDKLYDINPSDDEALISIMTPASSVSSGAMDTTDHCSTARRSSLRGHVKKGCGCCNGSPERPKSKKAITTKQHNVQQHQHQPQQQPQQSDGLGTTTTSATTTAVPATTASKIKKIAVKQQQSKQPAKKR